MYDAGLKGRPGDATFWNSMIKRGGTLGSGYRTWFNGWINIFFPYIQKDFNRYCVPSTPSASPAEGDIPLE